MSVTMTSAGLNMSGEKGAERLEALSVSRLIDLIRSHLFWASPIFVLRFAALL